MKRRPGGHHAAGSETHAERELGIYHYGARFYSPYINRFLSADTLVSNPANPQSLNRYSYVLNNPLKYTDPTGHKECAETDSHGSCMTGTQAMKSYIQ